MRRHRRPAPLTPTIGHSTGLRGGSLVGFFQFETTHLDGRRVTFGGREQVGSIARKARPRLHLNVTVAQAVVQTGGVQFQPGIRKGQHIAIAAHRYQAFVGVNPGVGSRHIGHAADVERHLVDVIQGRTRVKGQPFLLVGGGGEIRRFHVAFHGNGLARYVPDGPVDIGFVGRIRKLHARTQRVIYAAVVAVGREIYDTFCLIKINVDCRSQQHGFVGHPAHFTRR